MNRKSASVGVVSLAIVLMLAVSALSVTAGPGAKQNKGGAMWTFAIYMCSDNDLDYWGQLNVDWLMTVGSTAEVNFIVFWDKETEPARLYKVGKGSLHELTDFPYSGVEVNMGDPVVLEAFVSYLGSKFAAKNLLLDLWDHGDDFRGICFDYDTGTDVSMDYLTHQEIGDALAGKTIAVLAADGCGIGTIEVAYEYVVGGVTAEWFVASENYVPLEGFPYDRIAADLVANPGMSPEELSRIMVEHYAAFYQKGWLTELAAIRLPAVKYMVEELWDVTALLADDMVGYKGLVTSGRAQATMGWSQYGWEGYVDFPTIFEVVYSGAPSDSQLSVETGELLSAIEAAVPYVGAGSPCDVWDPKGISVFFPSAKGSYDNNQWWRGSLYPTMQFAQDGWLEFLWAYYAG